MNEKLSPWALPRDVSVDGWRVDWLMQITTVFVGLMFAATVIWILAACVLHGRKHKAQFDKGSAKSSVIKALALSVVIFGVVDGNLLFVGLADLKDGFWNFDKANASPNVVRLEINAHQWAWDARYAGADGVFNTRDDVVTMNDIRVPVNTPVVVQLGATDVIHSFSLPNFRVKQDAIPGMINRLWFAAKETGTFDIACAQHCGVHHYKMRGQLMVLSESDFKAWAQNASALSAAAWETEDKTAHWGWDWERRNK